MKMTGRTGITYHEVANAIATIQGKQKNPTVDAIRIELGTGSRSTIAKYFQEWKTKNGAKNVTETGIPNELQNLIQALWEKTQSDAEKRIEAHQAEVDAQINEAKNSVTLTQQQNTLLHSEIKTLSENLVDQNKNLEDQKIALHQSENEKATLSERISALEAHNLDHKNENDRLHALLKNTQNNLVHYQQAIEHQRHEQALLLEKQRSECEIKLSQVQNQLNNTMNEKTQYQTRFESITVIHDKLISDFDVTKNNMRLLQKNYDFLMSENTQIKNALEKSKNEHDQLLQKLESKKNENTNLYIQLKSSENNHDATKNSIGKLEQRMQTLQEQYEKTLQEKYSLESKINTK